MHTARVCIQFMFVFFLPMLVLQVLFHLLTTHAFSLSDLYAEGILDGLREHLPINDLC